MNKIKDLDDIDKEMFDFFNDSFDCFDSKDGVIGVVSDNIDKIKEINTFLDNNLIDFIDDRIKFMFDEIKDNAKSFVTNELSESNNNLEKMIVSLSLLSKHIASNDLIRFFVTLSATGYIIKTHDDIKNDRFEKIDEVDSNVKKKMEIDEIEDELEEIFENEERSLIERSGISIEKRVEIVERGETVKKNMDKFFVGSGFGKKFSQGKKSVVFFEGFADFLNCLIERKYLLEIMYENSRCIVDIIDSNDFLRDSLDRLDLDVQKLSSRHETDELIVNIVRVIADLRDRPFLFMAKIIINVLDVLFVEIEEAKEKYREEIVK